MELGDKKVTKLQNLLFALQAHRTMKEERLSIRVSKETKELVVKNAKKYNSKISNYIISVVKNRPIKVQALPDENALKLKIELNAIGKNLWLLLKHDKTLKLSEKIALEKLMLEIRKATQSIIKYYDLKGNNGNQCQRTITIFDKKGA